ncbi:MAG: hypothetical protein K9N38_09325 [Candidatus Marinimicrobia bacterium]|nr:hypothetical protein [Candidatus Neomarinimicrobiota bacterium]
MTIFDHILLFSAAVLAFSYIYAHWTQLIQNQEHSEHNIYHLIAFFTLGTSTLLLGIFGWSILGFMGDGTENKLVAIVASAIPFAWATGVVKQNHPKFEKAYLALMIIGFLLITMTRFAEMKTLGRILYPVFHSTAGLTVILLPILSVIKNRASASYLLVSVGGFLISFGGISMAFIIAGRQLMFVSQEVLFIILAPVLFMTTILYVVGLAGEVKKDF